MIHRKMYGAMKISEASVQGKNNDESNLQLGDGIAVEELVHLRNLEVIDFLVLG